METAPREKLRVDAWLNAMRVAGAKAEVAVKSIVDKIPMDDFMMPTLVLEQFYASIDNV